MSFRVSMVSDLFTNKEETEVEMKDTAEVTELENYGMGLSEI